MGRTSSTYESDEQSRGAQRAPGQSVEREIDSKDKPRQGGIGLAEKRVHVLGHRAAEHPGAAHEHGRYHVEAIAAQQKETRKPAGQ